jgi:hypothetical protein
VRSGSVEVNLAGRRLAVSDSREATAYDCHRNDHKESPDATSDCGLIESAGREWVIVATTDERNRVKHDFSLAPGLRHGFEGTRNRVAFACWLRFWCVRIELIDRRWLG